MLAADEGAAQGLGWHLAGDKGGGPLQALPYQILAVARLGTADRAADAGRSGEAGAERHGRYAGGARGLAGVGR